MVYGGEGSLTLGATVFSCVIILICFCIAEPFHIIIFYRWLTRNVEPVTGERKREFWMFGYRWIVYGLWLVEGIWLWFWTPFMTAQILFEFFNDHVTKTSVLIERGVYILTLSVNLIGLLIMWFLTECEEHRVSYESIGDYTRGAIGIGGGLALGYSIFYVIIMSSVQEDQYFYSGTNYNTWIGVLAVIELVIGLLLLGLTLYTVHFARTSVTLMRIDFRSQSGNYSDAYAQQAAYNPQMAAAVDPIKSGEPYKVQANFIPSRTIRFVVVTFLLLVLPYDFLEAIYSFGGCSLDVYINLSMCFKALTGFHVLLSCPLVLTAQNRKVDYF